MAANKVQQEWKPFPILERGKNKHEVRALPEIEQGKFCCCLKLRP